MRGHEVWEWAVVARRALLRHVLPAALLIYVGFGALLFFFQREFIYHPNDQAFDACVGLPPGTEVVRYGAHDTRAYYHSGSHASTTLIVLYHGNAGSACDRAWLARTLFAPAGTAFLLVEYTGYSGDARAPSATAIRANVLDTITFAREHKSERILVMGQSLGAAAATYHARSGGADALFLSTPFVSYAQLAREHYPIYPTRYLLRERFDTEHYLTHLKMPITITHGTDDSLTPPQHARHLALLTPASTTRRVEIPEAGHNDIYATTEWFTVAREFIAEHVSTTQPVREHRPSP